jgi:ribosomal protein S18 acetylase RimI-like enzyme
MKTVMRMVCFLGYDNGSTSVFPREPIETAMPTIHLKTRDGKNILLRPLVIGDGPALQQFNATLSEASRNLFLPHAYDDDTLAHIIERAEKGTDYTVIALAGETIVGYAFLWDFQDPVPVLGIGLVDNYQGQGLGKPLMEHLIDTARNAGATGIELTTVPNNERAFALYCKVGFEHTGNADNIAGDGRVVQERVMFLALRPGAIPPEREFKPPV